MKSLVCSALLTACLSPLSAWAIGNEGSGGGDLCEARFQSVARDINWWLQSGGASGLNLKDAHRDLSISQYSLAMEAVLAKFQVTCVGPGDAGYPVAVAGQAKECRSYRGSDGTGHVFCDRAKFYSGLANPENDGNQYRIVHHEFATLAGLEVPRGAASEYWLSDQITGFLSKQSVLKLAVKPNPANEAPLGKYRFKMEATTQDIELSPDRTRIAMFTPNGVVLRDLMAGKDVFTFALKPSEIGEVMFSPKGDHLVLMDHKNIETNTVYFLDTKTGATNFQIRQVGEILFFQDGLRFALLSLQGMVEIRSLGDGKILRAIPIPGLQGRKDIYFLDYGSTLSPNEQEILISYQNSNLSVDPVRRVVSMNLKSGKVNYVTPGYSPTFRTDGKLLAIAIDEGEGRKDSVGNAMIGAALLDPATGKEVQFIQTRSRVQLAHILKDGRLLFTHPGEGIIEIRAGEKFDTKTVLQGDVTGYHRLFTRMDLNESFYLGSLATNRDLGVSSTKTGHLTGTIGVDSDIWNYFVLSPNRALVITAQPPGTAWINDYEAQVIEIP